MTIELTIPEKMPRTGNNWLMKFGRFLLRLQGWKITGTLPNEPKVVVIFAPHTSNWDFTILASVWLGLDLKISYMMKKEAFFWPFSGFFKKIGGIPIDRTQSTDVVGQMVNWYRNHDECWLGITPEGTRSKVDYWKNGFMRIAHEASVPIMLVGIDATKNEIIVDKVVHTSGDHETQVEELRQYMNDKFIGINPKYQ